MRFPIGGWTWVPEAALGVLVIVAVAAVVWMVVDCYRNHKKGTR